MTTLISGNLLSLSQYSVYYTGTLINVYTQTYNIYDIYENAKQ